ncbi:MAG: adenylate/guanylate cyclase domain-containing protein [Chloroflexota bacterium]
MKFLFTDIEGSTRLWEKYGDVMGAALQQHDAILENEIGRWGGQIIKHTGDGIFAVFLSGNPLEFALHVQRKLRDHDWGTIGNLRVRYAIHAGDAQQRNGDYFGAAINQTTRVLATGRGEQILLTEAAASSSCVPVGASLQKLGVYRLRGVSRPLTIFELTRAEERQPTFWTRLRAPYPRQISLASHLMAIRHLAHSFIA